jgi:hypothetical protein
MKKLVVLILLLPVFVLLSGCTSSGGGSGPGVVISNVVVTPTTAEPNTPIILQATVQNQGGLKARNAMVEIFGLTDEWSISPGRSQSIGELIPPDTSRGSSTGEEQVFTWELRAPAKSNDMTYNGNVNLRYTYDTTLEALIKVVTIDYYRQTGTTGGIDSQTTSGGPISMTVVAPSTIISGGRVPIQIEVQNAGSGKVIGDHLRLTISGIGCSRTDVTLVSGTTTPYLYCWVDASAVNEYKDFPITIKTTYDYWVESPFSVTVLKTPPI